MAPSLRAVQASLLSLPLLACAQEFQSYVQFNGSSHGPHDGFETFQNADQDPKAKHSVTFDLNGDNSASEHWTWTLQTSNVSLPNISTSIQDAHVAYTTWHFAVEGNSSAETSSSTPTCVTLLDVNFPANVSSAWDPSSASCTSAIGSECEQAILNGTVLTDDCSRGNFHTYGPRFLDACRSAFGPDGILSLAYPFDAANATDGVFAWALSDPFSGGNTTAFQDAKEKLRLMVVTGNDEKQVLCNRVSNSTADGDSDTSDASTNVRTSGNLLAASLLFSGIALWL